MKKLLLASVLGLSTLATAPASAQGAFDFLDPCIKARSDFDGQRQHVRGRFANFEASIPTMTATPEFREAWMQAKRQQARPYFDKEVAPALERYGLTDAERAFDAWFKDIIASLQPEELESLVNTTYRLMAREELARGQAKTEAEYEKAKSELDGSCRSDVGSQVLRVAMAPIGWVGGNIEGAQREHNIVTQVFRGVTGVSARDIASHGILGGENSELRKLARAIAGGPNSEVNKALRILDPSNTSGILGGPNSAARVIPRQIEQVVNPFRWRF